ncbi:hypothetical protein OAS86_06070 [Gammaproteobacteria bacterium]|nr:hypothetical protein [Gammaproteobacteria bacterium]
MAETQRFPMGLADISADRGTLYLPLMLDGKVKKQPTTVWMEK